ncbi:hypothetical protein BgiBS90_024829 [Biomphalaria glabrata]|nr:hypothetical protein BgiBS90_024829 [Biomphalaria glabrata]
MPDMELHCTPTNQEMTISEPPHLHGIKHYHNMLTQCLVWPGLTPQYINKEKKHLHLIVDCNDCDAATMIFPKAGHQKKKSFPQNQQQDAVRAIRSFSRN